MSTPNIKWPALSTGGSLRVEDKQKFQDYLRTIEGEVTLVVARKTKERSHPQNRYYWSVCVGFLSEYLGYEPEMLHDILKNLFLKSYSEQYVNGKMQRFVRIRSTTELTTKEFENYTSQIRRWAATELNFSIPEPGETETI